MLEVSSKHCPLHLSITDKKSFFSIGSLCRLEAGNKEQGGTGCAAKLNLHEPKGASVQLQKHHSLGDRSIKYYTQFRVSTHITWSSKHATCCLHYRGTLFLPGSSPGSLPPPCQLVQEGGDSSGHPTEEEGGVVLEVSAALFSQQTLQLHGHVSAGQLQLTSPCMLPVLTLICVTVMSLVTICG